MAKVYVASSWRNAYQPSVVKTIRGAGHDVYDFRNPAPGDHGFHWSEIHPNWLQWSTQEFASGLDHPLAVDGFDKDRGALDWCEVCVLVLPSGASSHLEFGYAAGQGKRTAILAPQTGIEPELMYRFAGLITDCDSQLLQWLDRPSGAS